MSIDGSEDLAQAIERLKRRLPAELDNLATLAYNYWWSWTPGGAALFESIAPLRWHQCGENPVRQLEEANLAHLDALSADGAFVARVNAFAAQLGAYLQRPDAPMPASRPGTRVHMCAEYGVHVSLPIYAGGLGVLMGDYLKEASDQAVPTAAFGLMYWQGSFHQRFDVSGWQHEYWVATDAPHLPAALVTDPNGHPLMVEVPARGRLVSAQIWRVDVGRVPLYLLDTNLTTNEIADRWITSRLYLGDREMRLAQYAVLGIGGIRAMRAMGIEPSVIHLNEGHAALAAIEMLREHLVAGRSFEDAVERVRDLTTFTTHTPVPAGHDTFSADETRTCLIDLPGALNLDWDRFLALGRARPDDVSERFGTTPLALHLSRAANGVSRVHGEVSRAIWGGMWPNRPVSEVPISHITNGVHVPTWMAPEMQALLDRYLRPDWRARICEPETWAAVDDIPDEELWAVRCELRHAMVQLVRERSVLDRLGRGEPASYAESAADLLDDRVLTLGFVRRIATYKRLYLITADAQRGLRLLAGDPPVQLVMAGKAHPDDDAAKRTVQGIFALNRLPLAAGRAVFLEDLDLAMEPCLVAGCDVWVNLPRPPNEASGTSGMKSALNGGLQLSVLDGWWPEAYDGSNGWAIDTPPGVAWAEQDAHDAAALYTLLESQVAPLFNGRTRPGEMPRAWVSKIKTSMKSLAPRFNATRMLREYAEIEAGGPVRSS